MTHHSALLHTSSLTRSRQSPSLVQVPAPMLKDIDQYTKEELYQYLVHLTKAEHQASSSSQAANGGEPPENPHAVTELLSAAHVLQQDVFTIIKKFRELNIELEQEVQARTHALAVNEANLSALVENTSDLILLVDADLQIQVVNSAFRRMVAQRYGLDVPRGAHLSDACPPQLMDHWMPHFEKALAGETFKVEEMLEGDEQKIVYELSFNPIVEAEGGISGVSFFGKDITEKYLAMEEVRAQQQLLESINYNIKEGLFRTFNGRIIYVNKSFIDMMGYESLEEMKAIDPYDLYVQASRRDEFVAIMQAHTYFVNEEVHFKRKDGSTFWALMSSIKTIDAQTGQVFYDGAIRDITELKDTKRQLEQQNEELTKVNEELDRFVYSTSHDLRAPLVSVSGLISVTRLAQDESERETYLDLMEKSISKLDGFIQDIISYSRNARMQVRCEALDVQSLVEESLQNLQYLDGAADMCVEIQIHPGEMPFYGDRTRLEIILNNLISNSIRYQDRNKQQRLLRVTVTINENHAHLQVADNGIGIDDAAKPQIFNMFYRGNHRSQGSGIGLYIVRETVNRLGGSISVSSTLGEGTTFDVIIPSATDR